jgi:hypothetical protein
LIEALPFAEFNPHAFLITPPQVDMTVGGFPANPDTTLITTQGQPCMIASIAPAIGKHRIPYDGDPAYFVAIVGAMWRAHGIRRE